MKERVAEVEIKIRSEIRKCDQNLVSFTVAKAVPLVV